MLVLSRARDEAVCIGHDIQITVVDIRGDKVRLGITAPREVSVDRREVYEAKHSHSAAVSGAAAAPGLMRAALQEALCGLAEGGLPIGAVLVRGGQVIAAGRDRRAQTRDPLAHAQLECLRAAGRQSTWHDTVLYTTLMPAWLGAAAVAQLGIPRVVAGDAVNTSRAGADFLRSRCVQVADLHDADCIRTVDQFIQAHAGLWRELTEPGR